MDHEADALGFDYPCCHAFRCSALSGLENRNAWFFESSVLAIALHGFVFNWLPFVSGILLASTFFTLVGSISVTRFSTLEEYLLPSVLYGALASLPLITGLAQWGSPLLLSHPIHAVLVVLQSAFAPVDTGLLVYGVLYSGGSVSVLFFICTRLYQGMIVGIWRYNHEDCASDKNSR